MTHNIHDKIEKIDEEILRLLHDRASICQDAAEEDPELLGPEYQSDVVAQWDAAADEHGWNPAATMRVCRGVIDLCKPLE
jgi:chorismate mutase